MLTIFTIPKSFRDGIDIIQRNSIQSWLQLFPKCEIILFGDDEGVMKTAKEFNILYISEVEKTKLGTPLLSSAITLAQEKAKYDILLYLNTDIILTSDLISAVQRIKIPIFLMSGQRWDVDINEEIDFDNPVWENKLREKIIETGELHGPTGMDYFIIPKSLPDKIKMPRLVVGRPGWDNWLIYRALSLKIPMIDATKVITAVHQNHDYSHSKYGNSKKGKVGGPETQMNIKLIGGFDKMCTLKDSDWILTSEEGLKPKTFFQRFFIRLSLLYPWRLILSFKRKIQFNL